MFVIVKAAWWGGGVCLGQATLTLPGFVRIRRKMAITSKRREFQTDNAYGILAIVTLIICYPLYEIMTFSHILDLPKSLKTSFKRFANDFL